MLNFSVCNSFQEIRCFYLINLIFQVINLTISLLEFDLNIHSRFYEEVFFRHSQSILTVFQLETFF